MTSADISQTFFGMSSPLCVMVHLDRKPKARQFGGGDMRVGGFKIEPLMVLLVFVPIAIALEFMHADPVWIFVASSAAIIPLAGLMGKATEHLAEKLGAGIGGLLNATFGNAAELIIALIALRAGLHEVVKASITGSIIGNILLVLGLAFITGGAKYP